MKNMKAGSLSNWPFLTLVSTEAQNFFHKSKTSFLQKELFNDFFLVLATARTTEKWKKKKIEKEDEKKEEKEKKNGKTKTEK